MKLNALTGLRFVFAFMVFLCHLTYFADSGIPALQNLLKHYFHYGYLGVNFFFILSGFVLAYTYGTQLAEGTLNRRKFLLKRIFRIVPLHYLMLLLAMPLVIKSICEAGGFDAHHTMQFAVKLFAHLTLLQSFIPAMPYYFSFNNPSWSISAEMFFYFLFPSIASFIINRGLLKSYGIYLVIIICAFVFMTFIRNFYDLHWLFYINPFVRVLDFIMGIFLCYFYKIVKHVRPLSAAKATGLQLLSVFLFVVFFLQIEKVYRVYAFSLYFYVPMMLVIFSFAWDNGWLAKRLASKTMLMLGEASFCFYLVQDIVARYINWNGNRLNLIQDYFLGNHLLFAGFQLALALLATLIIHKYFEMPVRNLLMKKYLSS